MLDLTNQDIVAAMLADPPVPITRYDFDYQVGLNFNTGCRLHYVPAPAPIDPGAAPLPPIAPAPLSPKSVGRPKNGRKQVEADFKIATEAFEAAMAAYPAVLAAHAARVATYQAHVANTEASQNFNDRPSPDFIFTHGKGTRLDAPALVAFTEGFARTQCMLSFNDTRSHNERASTFRSLLNNFPSTSALGGRSMGAQACARAQLYGRAKKLIFFSYPLVSGLTIRTEELTAIEADVDVLFIIGDEDPKATELHFRDARSKMRCRTWYMKVVRGDHSMLFSPEFPEKRVKMCNVVGQIAARWSVERDPERTEMVVDWEGEDGDGRPVWTDWVKRELEPQSSATRVEISFLGPHLPGGGSSFGFTLPR